MTPPARLRRYVVLGIAAILALVMGLTVSCAGSSPAPPNPPPTYNPYETGHVFFSGATTLEERIAASAVVAKVRLRSVVAGSERWKLQHYDLAYVGTLEHRFEVLEYLKGNGASEIVGIVYSPDDPKETPELATAAGTDLLSRRDTRWDARDAIVFLEADRPWMPGLPKADRYVLGSIWLSLGAGGDIYSIRSNFDKKWLPAETGGAVGASATSGSQRFLLDAPPDGDGASGQTGTPMITLAEMKERVGGLEREATAGGGSDAYRDCLYEKYRLAREVGSLVAARGTYGSIRFDSAIGSGLPAGVLVHTYLDAWQEPKPTAAELNRDGEFRLIGRDRAFFALQQPTGVYETARPLPAGEYKFNPYYINDGYILCEAMPEEHKEFYDVFVTATAPTGTAHEAFFDPVAIGTAVGADGTNGVLKPTAFSVGGVSTGLQTLKWESGTLTLGLSSAASLSGHALDFIALDGSVALSLDGGAATVSGGTLTWSVADQPWQAGDLLMLRIRTGAATPVGTPTATPTATATATPDATPTATATPAPNTAPAFGSSTYAFSVAETTSTWTIIGTVAATDEDGDTVSHYITAGNGAGKFNIDLHIGLILIWKALDYETTSSYTLTVEARDGNGGVDTATVTITVTDVEGS